MKERKRALLENEITVSGEDKKGVCRAVCQAGREKRRGDGSLGCVLA